MTAYAPAFAFLGLFAGPWKLAIVAGLVALVFGRRLRPSALLVRTTRPARPGDARPRSRLGDRLFLLLLVMAATAVATWILAHMTIVSAVRATP